MVFEEYLTLWHLQMLLLYVVANCALPWYAIWRNRRLQPDPVRDQAKFLPWVRDDAGQWSYVACVFTHFFFLLRYALMLLTLLYALLVAVLFSLGTSIDNLSETRRWLILEHTCLCMRVFSIWIGNWVSTTRRPAVDYRKWLGPDWKPTYEGATMLVSNH